MTQKQERNLITMSMNFEIIGTIKGMKETDKFKPYDVKTFDSKWQTHTYKFNAISGTNRFMLTISGGKWEDDSKNQIYTYSKAEAGKKGEKMTVKWADRRKPEIISKVSGFRIYTCNLLTYDEKKALEDEGKADEAAKKNHQFIEATEYAALVKKVIDSGKYADTKFKIVGTVDFQYSASKGQYYSNYTVNKMYKVPDDTPCKAELTINAFYTADSFDAEMYDETKKYMFNCYTDYYFSSIKENRFVPISLVIKGDGDDQAEKRALGFKKKLTAFDDEAVVRKIGLKIDMIDGAEAVAITYDDLDEDTREDIDFGLITLEDAIKALGGTMNGNKVTEYRIKALDERNRKSEPTVYTLDDLRKLPVVEEEEVEIDLFADSDDDDFII
jgi:hypothetical protein